MSLTNTNNLRDEIDIMLRHYIDGIKIRTKCNRNDSAVDAEGFFRNFLNLVYKFNLSKDKIESSYNDTIDLHSIERRICVQVTAQNKKTKVEETVKLFIQKNKHNLYNELHFVILDRERSFKYNKTKLSPHQVEIFFHDYTTIFKKLIDDFDSYDKIKEVYDFVKSELEGEESSLNEINIHKEQPTLENNEKLKSLHIVDQIYKVLKSFEGFNCIYPRTIAKLYPFTIGKHTHDVYSHYCHKTNNKAIHELLQNVKVENHILTINDETLKPFEEKLNEIFSILNHSLIRCICYREKYTEIEHHKINVTSSNSECNCLFCQYRKFNIKPLFATLKEKSFHPSENLNDALEEAYYLCKLGEHTKGWQLLDSIATKSKEKNKSVNHFLALYNITQIRSFINSPWWENEQKQILPKIDNIDLHNTLCTFTLPIEVRNELIRIKEDYYLHYSREQIDEHYTEISDLKSLYSRGGYSSGSSTLSMLWEEIHILYYFYSANNIISDDFYTFRAAITRGIEAILISYSIDERYEYKYKEFDNLILSLMIFYIEEELLEKIFKNNDITELSVLDAHKKSFLKTIENFFLFQFTKGIWDHIKFNEDILRQDYFSHYRQELRHIFNRIMLILSRVELNDEELKPLAEPITDFLRAAEDFNHTNWRYALKFFEKRIQIFNTQQIQTIIEQTFNERQHRSGDDVFERICQLAFSKANFILTDLEFFEQLIGSITTPCKKCKQVHDTKQLLACWSIANENGKQIIKKKSIEYLENKFDPDFYQHAVFQDIFTKDEQPTLLQQYISYANNCCSPFDIKEEKGRWIAQSYVGFNCINCLAYLNIDFKQENMQTISEKSEYYNWVINYESYDYSAFNTKWLIDLCPYYIKDRLRSVPGLKNKIIEELKKEYDACVAKFFVEYLN